jgi:hypothetical protein
MHYFSLKIKGRTPQFYSIFFFVSEITHRTFHIELIGLGICFFFRSSCFSLFFIDAQVKVRTIVLLFVHCKENLWKTV